MKSYLYRNYSCLMKDILDNLEKNINSKHILHNPTEAQIMCTTQDGYKNPADWQTHLKSVCDTVNSDTGHPLHQNLIHISAACDFNNVKSKIWNTQKRHIKFGTGFEWREFLFHNIVAEYADHDHNYRTRPAVSRSFACLIKKPRPHRIQLLNCLIKNNLSDKGFITFACLPEDKEMLNRFTHLKIDLDAVQKHQEKFQFKDQPNRQGFQLSLEAPSLVKNYEPCAIDIVAETDVQYTVISEKCLRPIIYGKPFVIFGNRHNFFLKQMGFELFTELFDYGFEDRLIPNHGSDYQNPEELQPVFDQLAHWCTVPPHHIMNTCTDKIEHNKSVLVNILLNDQKLQELQDTYPEHQDVWQSNQKLVDKALNFIKTDPEFSKFV